MVGCEIEFHPNTVKSESEYEPVASATVRPVARSEIETHTPGQFMPKSSAGVFEESAYFQQSPPTEYGDVNQEQPPELPGGYTFSHGSPGFEQV